MKKSDVVAAILGEKVKDAPVNQQIEAYAPVNIALCKYWGKRETELNLPRTSSLSVALPEKGCKVHLSIIDEKVDRVILNGEGLDSQSRFAKGCKSYLDLFRAKTNWNVQLDIQSNIPVAAGFASSASGFASLIQALDGLFGASLSKKELSILARLGSGSASRSLWNGFVEWHAGSREDGMDSYAEPIQAKWPGLYVGLLVMSRAEKSISSREAMQRTVETSKLYKVWPQIVEEDLKTLHKAIKAQCFETLAACAESNALAMHATMLNSWPPVSYMLPETVAAMHKIWQARHDGLKLYFTQDAGSNLKLIVQEKELNAVKVLFPGIELIKLF